MAIFLCLNELSCTSRLPADEVDRVMQGFVRVLAEVRRARPNAVLISPERLPGVELAAGYPMAKWANDPRNRDRWRLVRAMQQRAPFTFDQVVPEGSADELEYRHGGRAALGLGAAHLVDGLAVSLSSERVWDTDEVQVDRTSLTEEAEVVEERVRVAHASAEHHFEAHRERFKRDGLADLSTGAALWGARADHFPALRFLPAVETHFRDLTPNWVVPVRERLAELQDSAAGWPAGEPFPEWQSLVTPEGEQRKRLCYFVDVDGVKYLFDLHARFTPGVGRIHFRVSAEERKLIVAHVGRKIGV
ncbi:hypothetical protein KCV87_15705 [Actinosynnema pretiosum subsp. pretiosum]|uniref:Uncharacterized protein n=1 Tax=Actinosynnema pretiosum subsp. pretiosum TaxID=103721 RepID=A0AA45LC60_9PSEU|nr:hypothetical protein APASM_0925 [Actinosynnema pretiosum subsp. pretiosum]QUF07342.1 hypothetical protein KCV87_15705 [Actinosynnema pretiosum subsp. pretiosum]